MRSVDIGTTGKAAGSSDDGGSGSKESQKSDDIYLAAVEGGGTTFVVSIARLVRGSNEHPMPPPPTVGDKNDVKEIVNFTPDVRFEILSTKSIPSNTGNPEDTLDECCRFFRENRPKQEDGSPIEQFDSVGIASFGPVGVDPTALDSYGLILPSSPKADWRNVDVLAPILNACSTDIASKTRKKNLDGSDKLHVPPPHLIDTDVNAPALAEFSYYNSKALTSVSTKPPPKRLTSLAYVTVGTGVGVGLIMNEKPVHGMMHPEGGHVAVVPLKGDTFPGYSWGKEKCPYQGVNTVEGITSSVALTERIAHEDHRQKLLKKKKSSAGIFSTSGSNLDSAKPPPTDDPNRREALKNLPDDHYVWPHASNALANLCVNLVLMTSVERIVFGGGVMKRSILLDQIRSKTRELLNGYLDLPQVTTDEGLQSYIAPETWKDKSGLVGALVLAMNAYDEYNRKHEEDHMRHLAAIIAAKEMQESSQSLRHDDDRSFLDTVKDTIVEPNLAVVVAGTSALVGTVLLSKLLMGRK